MPTTVPKSAPPSTTTAEDATEAPFLKVRSLLTEFLQAYYGRVEEPFKWDPEENRSKIVIATELPLRLQSLGDRPALVVVRGNAQLMHLGMEDADEETLATGQRVRRLLLTGALIVQAVSRNMLESEHLAFQVGNAVWALHGQLQRMGFFHIGQNIAYGAPGTAGDLVQNSAGDEMYSTPVSIPYYFPWAASITPINLPILSRIDAVLHTPQNRIVPKPVPGEGPPHSPIAAVASAPGRATGRVPRDTNPARTWQTGYPTRPRRGLPLSLADVRVSPVYPPSKTPIKV